MRGWIFALAVVGVLGLAPLTGQAQQRSPWLDPELWRTFDWRNPQASTVWNAGREPEKREKTGIGVIERRGEAELSPDEAPFDFNFQAYKKDPGLYFVSMSGEQLPLPMASDPTCADVVGILEGAFGAADAADTQPWPAIKDLNPRLTANVVITQRTFGTTRVTSECIQLFRDFNNDNQPDDDAPATVMLNSIDFKPVAEERLLTKTVAFDCSWSEGPKGAPAGFTADDYHQEVVLPNGRLTKSHFEGATVTFATVPGTWHKDGKAAWGKAWVKVDREGGTATLLTTGDKVLGNGTCRKRGV